MRSDPAGERFRREFGGEPAWRGRAPGRVNLIGEHVDYLGGLVLPAAIDRETVIAGGAAAGWTVRSDVPGGERYLAALAAELGAGPQAVAIVSDVPPGAGVSSSAALLVAAAAGLDPAGDGMAIALACRRAEQAATGVGVGPMDQLASALGRAGHALLIDCERLSVEQVPFPGSLAIAVLDSGVRRRLAETPYEQRRRAAEAGLEAAGGHLLDLDPAVAGPALQHAVAEVGRVRRFVEALRGGGLEEMGGLMVECHRSLRDVLRVSVPEADAIVERACRAPGCLGARIMGAGFGGSVLALLRAGTEGEFMATVGAPGFVCRTASGPFAS